MLACTLLTQKPLIHNEPHLHYYQHPVHSHWCRDAWSISCYHSVLPPCLSTLLTSSRFSSLLNRHPYILLISLEIFFITCLYTFFIISKIVALLAHPRTTSPAHTCKEPLPQQQVGDPPCNWAGNRAIRRAPESNMYVCDVDIYSDRKAYQCDRITCSLLRNNIQNVNQLIKVLMPR